LVYQTGIQCACVPPPFERV